MSDSSISIVPSLSRYPNKTEKAKEILLWLVSRDIVKPELSDCVLSDKGGYAISDGAKEVVEEQELAYLPSANGLQIITNREIFSTAQNGLDSCICPACKKDIASEPWDFFDEWFEEKSDNITCPLCKVGSDIHSFQFTPQWSFSDLGFIFWNWPGLKDSFIKEFEQRLGCRVAVVCQHI